jgi:hypothetical protein
MCILEGSLIALHNERHDIVTNSKAVECYFFVEEPPESLLVDMAAMATMGCSIE